MNGEIRVVSDVPAAFADLLTEAWSSRADQYFSLALSGGSTATPCYQALVGTPIDWETVSIVWGDERCVPLDHDDSNFLLAKKALLDAVEAPYGLHPMICGDDGAASYERLIEDLTPLDFVHLGMGDDGHTASLFPGSPALHEDRHRVVETGDDLHPHRRMTLTYKALNEARLAVFTVQGAKKREMFSRIRDGEDFPASHVASKRVIWLVDEAAAS